MSRPFILYGQSEISRLTATLEPIMSNWIQQWLADAQAQVHCTQAGPDSLTDGEWLHAKSSKGSHLYINRPSSFSKLMTLELFGDLPKSAGLGDTPSPLVADAIQSILLGLIKAVNAGLSPNKSNDDEFVLIKQEPPTAEFLEGSGACLVALKIGTFSLQILISAQLSLEFFRAKGTGASRKSTLPALENALEQIQTKSVKLYAFLGEAEIDIGTLQTISVGDVIRLDTSVDQPAQLTTESGVSLCNGYLGASENFKSLQLCR